MDIRDIRARYEQQIKPRSLAERRQLLALLRHDLEGDSGTQRTSIPELEGLGAEIWQGVDAQEYVAALRHEWDHRV